MEAPGGLVLVDTGFGTRDVRDPWSRLSRVFLALLAPDFRDDMTAVRQVERLGFDPRDVRDIVLTHLDFDHAGGLDDVPHATVHLLEDERNAATAQRTLLDRMRYRPRQWSTRARWRTYRTDRGDDWYGFSRVRTLDGLAPDVVMVPLVGHTLGHAGIAVRREDDWLLLAGDAYFHHAEMDTERPSCTPGLRAYQWLMQKDAAARHMNQRRLRGLRRTHGAEVEVLSSHDVVEFERSTGHAAHVPVAPARRVREPSMTSTTSPASLAFALGGLLALAAACGPAQRPPDDTQPRERYIETLDGHDERPGKHSTTTGRHGTSGEIGGGIDTQSGPEGPQAPMD